MKTFYALMYPATRCEDISRDDLKEAVRDYMQEALNEIRRLDTPSGRYKYREMIDDLWTVYHGRNAMIRALFGLIASVDGDTVIIDDIA